MDIQYKYMLLLQSQLRYTWIYSSLCSCSSPSLGIHGYIVVYAPALVLAQVYMNIQQFMLLLQSQLRYTWIYSSLFSCSSPSSGIHEYIVVYASALVLAQVYMDIQQFMLLLQSQLRDIWIYSSLCSCSSFTRCYVQITKIMLANAGSRLLLKCYKKLLKDVRK